VSRKNKLKKFSEVLAFTNVVQNFDYLDPKLQLGEEIIDLKGRWSEYFFKNKLPITLELACGRGEYTVGLAQHYAGRNFLGVDVKGARIWKGAKAALELGLQNAGFLRTRIEQLDLFFAEEEVDEIWITFPDPFLSKESNRLTHHRFLQKYLPIIKNGGYIHLKTDDTTLYEFTLESLQTWEHGEIVYHSADIYSAPLYDEVLAIKTYYETLNMGRGKTIKYIKYKIEK
jgi:tRNA (guanine-N7-)-methyltransferase